MTKSLINLLFFTPYDLVNRFTLPLMNRETIEFTPHSFWWNNLISDKTNIPFVPKLKKFWGYQKKKEKMGFEQAPPPAKQKKKHIGILFSWKKGKNKCLKKKKLKKKTPITKPLWFWKRNFYPPLKSPFFVKPKKKKLLKKKKKKIFPKYGKKPFLQAFFFPKKRPIAPNLRFGSPPWGSLWRKIFVLN
jgi:hypothetical protein